MTKEKIEALRKVLAASVAALTVEAEKKAGEKKVKAFNSEAAILAQIKEGSDYYKATEKKLETLSAWKPGQKASGEKKSAQEVITAMFGTKTTVYARTVLIISDNPIADNLEIAGCRIFSKDSDKTRINYRYDGNPEIVERDGAKLILHADRIPATGEKTTDTTEVATV